jgi:gamma-F420-2:alpha-L-glutamate ligase
MRGWLLFHGDHTGDAPEAPEIRRFLEVGTKRGHELQVLRPREFELIVRNDRHWKAEYEGKLLPRPDFIIPRTGSESSYFTLAVLRHFEQQGVAMINGAAAVDGCADKLRTLQILSAAGLPIPRTVLAKFPANIDIIEEELGFPVILKTLRGTRGAGVVLCPDRNQCEDLAMLLGDTATNADFIFQQYIASSHGRDVRVLVVGDKAVAAMARMSPDGGFKSNVSLGGRGLRYDPPPEMAELAVAAAKAMGCDVAGVDILFDEQGYRICEVNSSPGFQGLEKATSISVPDVILGMAERRLAPPANDVAPRWRRIASKLLGGKRRRA